LRQVLAVYYVFQTVLELTVFKEGLELILPSAGITGMCHHSRYSYIVFELAVAPIKTKLRFQLISVRIAIIKNTTTNKCWQGCGEKGTLIYCW
jgi:hypothetical protein